MSDFSINIIFYITLTITFFRLVYSIKKTANSTLMINFHVHLLISMFLFLAAYELNSLSVLKISNTIFSVIIINAQVALYFLLIKTYNPVRALSKSLSEIFFLVLLGFFFVKNSLLWMHGVILALESFMFYIIYNFSGKRNIGRYSLQMFLSSLFFSFSWLIFLSKKIETPILPIILVASAIFIASSSLDTFFYRKRLRTMLDLIINISAYSFIIILTSLFQAYAFWETNQVIDLKEIMIVTFLIIIFISLLSSGKYVLLRLTEKIFYTEAFDFRKKIGDTFSYAQSIVKWDQFITYLKGVFGEFYQSQDVLIVTITEEDRQVSFYQNDKVIKTSQYDSKGDVYKELHDSNYIFIKNNKLKNYPFLKLNDLLFKVYDDQKKITAVVVNLKSDKISEYEVIMLVSRLISLKRITTHIELFEKKKRNLFNEMKESQEGMNINALQTENLVLKRSYEQIREIQEELVSKEREASMAKLTMSLDDDISSPLSNMYMSVSYFIQKYEKNHTYQEKEAEALLSIIMSQSNRIKELLEKLRDITENTENKEKLINGNMSSFFSEKGQES